MSFNAVQVNLHIPLTEIKRSLGIFDDKINKLVSVTAPNIIVLDEVMHLNVGDWISVQNQDFVIENINYVNKQLFLVRETPLDDFPIESPVTWHHANSRFVDLLNAAKSSADAYLDNPFYAKDEEGNLVQAIPAAIKEWCIQYISRYYNVNEVGAFKTKNDLGEAEYSNNIFKQIQYWRLHYINPNVEIDPSVITYSDKKQEGYVYGLRKWVYYAYYL